MRQSTTNPSMRDMSYEERCLRADLFRSKPDPTIRSIHADAGRSVVRSSYSALSEQAEAVFSRRARGPEAQRCRG